MKIPFKGTDLSYKKIVHDSKNKKAILFLHGFTGSSNDWTETAENVLQNYNCYLLDLIGHGDSSSPVDAELYTANSIVEQILALTKIIEETELFLVGYSMGGRAALNFTVKYQNLLKGIILESTSPGIINESEKQERIVKDEKLAEFIRDNPIEKFVDYWMNLDMFKTQKKFPKEILEKIKNQKLANNRTGLANSLLSFGAGKMPALQSKLKNISLKTLLITGELDKKYTLLNAEMTKIFPNAMHVVVKDAGHNVHLEKTAVFIDELNKFLAQFKSS